MPKTLREDWVAELNDRSWRKMKLAYDLVISDLRAHQFHEEADVVEVLYRRIIKLREDVQ